MLKNVGFVSLHCFALHVSLNAQQCSNFLSCVDEISQFAKHLLPSTLEFQAKGRRFLRGGASISVTGASSAGQGASVGERAGSWDGLEQCRHWGRLFWLLNDLVPEGTLWNAFNSALNRSVQSSETA